MALPAGALLYEPTLTVTYADPEGDAYAPAADIVTGRTDLSDGSVEGNIGLAGSPDSGTVLYVMATVVHDDEGREEGVYMVRLKNHTFSAFFVTAEGGQSVIPVFGEEMPSGSIRFRLTRVPQEGGVGLWKVASGTVVGDQVDQAGWLSAEASEGKAEASPKSSSEQALAAESGYGLPPFTILAAVVVAARLVRSRSPRGPVAGIGFIQTEDRRQAASGTAINSATINVEKDGSGVR